MDLLVALKIDLGITVNNYDERLTQYIAEAVTQITREGATIDLETDGNLIVMYAAWLWRKRDSGEGMPRMLRYALNNRVFSEKLGGE